MAVVCPTITAYDPHEYRAQVEQVESFAKRIHIDLMDGIFAPNQSPGLDQIWWPENITADIHLMYERPAVYIDQIIKLKPSLLIMHYESDIDHKKTAERLQDHKIKAGLAILQETPAEEVIPVLSGFDHVLIFSGHLGEHGGIANLDLLQKVTAVRQSYPDIEISWDGGINAKNAAELAKSGVNVLNTGGYIQKSADPAKTYKDLVDLLNRL